jgi:N-acetylmuramoyl-L-alanine amidase
LRAARRIPTLIAFMRSLAFILVLLPALADAATWNIVLMNQRRYLPISDVAAFYRMTQAVSSGSSFRLAAANRVIEGRDGTSDVRINGVKYVTCFPLRSRNDTVYISAMDVSKIIEPVMRPGKIQGATPVRTIVLDAGHGGHDSGAVGSLGREKQYTLDVVLRARALLLKAGFQVKMTRTTDVFIPLDVRAAFANSFPNALFVSVHFNKSNTYGGTGIETYALAPRGVPSMDEASLRYSDFKLNPGNACDSQNIALAAAVHSALCRRLPVPDRGVKRARFAVIRNIRIPGVLIEGGFVDSAYDARLIATAEYRQRIAQSILDAVTAYTRAVSGAAPQSSAVITVKPPATTVGIDLADPSAPSTKLDTAASKIDLNGGQP